MLFLFRNTILILGLAFFAAPVWADTDYQCLKGCMGTGKVSAVCMQECSYQPTVKSSETPSHEEKYSPREFDELHRGNYLLPTGPEAAKVTREKNYGCMKNCLSGHLQYQLCETKCSRP